MFITNSEKQELNDWANVNKNRFTPNGFGRQFGIFSNIGYPKAALAIRKRIIEQFSLGSAIQEPMFKDYCGYITEGGAIHKHSDPNQGDLIHTRFNVLISKPVSGGIPVQNDKEIVVEEGDVWRCDAGIVKHWCTEVVGGKPRIVCSFGFLL
jgi:hypothetical protein